MGCSNRAAPRALLLPGLINPGGCAASSSIPPALSGWPSQTHDPSGDFPRENVPRHLFRGRPSDGNPCATGHKRDRPAVPGSPNPTSATPALQPKPMKPKRNVLDSFRIPPGVQEIASSSQIFHLPTKAISRPLRHTSNPVPIDICCLKPRPPLHRCDELGKMEDWKKKKI
jgi:hypothetical protein